MSSGPGRFFVTIRCNPLFICLAFLTKTPLERHRVLQSRIEVAFDNFLTDMIPFQDCRLYCRILILSLICRSLVTQPRFCI